MYFVNLSPLSDPLQLGAKHIKWAFQTGVAAQNRDIALGVLLIHHPEIDIANNTLFELPIDFQVYMVVLRCQNTGILCYSCNRSRQILPKPYILL